MGNHTARLAGEEGDGFVTNEVNVESIKNRLFPAVKEGTKRSEKTMKHWKKYCSFQPHMMKIKGRHYNQLDFGEVL